MNRNDKGEFVESKYPKKELVSECVRRLKNGESDTEVAKWLLMEKDVLLYSALSFVQQAKKLVLDTAK